MPVPYQSTQRLLDHDRDRVSCPRPCPLFARRGGTQFDMNHPACLPRRQHGAASRRFAPRRHVSGKQQRIDGVDALTTLSSRRRQPASGASASSGAATRRPLRRRGLRSRHDSVGMAWSVSSRACASEQAASTILEGHSVRHLLDRRNASASGRTTCAGRHPPARRCDRLHRIRALLARNQTKRVPRLWRT